MLLLTLIICGSVVSCFVTVGATIVVKNRDDNQLERDKLNVQFLQSQAREEDEYVLKDRLRSVIWKLSARDRRQLLLGDGEDINEVREALNHLMSEVVRSKNR